MLRINKIIILIIMIHELICQTNIKGNNKYHHIIDNKS